MQTLKAFHNDPKVKAKYLKRVRAHIKADNLIRGKGWEQGKGCAVGCTLENYDHSRYPVELGIPERLARLEDILFEGMSLKKSKMWPEQFLKAIKTGVNLEKTKVSFICVVLEHSLISMSKVVYNVEKWPSVTAAIEQSKLAVQQMIVAQKSGSPKMINQARSAAYSAYSAACSAAYSAYSADSADSAYSAADSAYSARSAADSAYSAAYSAYSADSADSAYSAADSAYSAAYSAYSAADSAYSARSAAYDHFADKLLKILKAIK